MSDLIICSNSPAIIETDCIIEHEGIKFESGGSLLMPNDKGVLVGVMYADFNKKYVSSWDGSLKIPAVYGREWTSNMGDKRQVIHFEYKNKKFSGIWYRGIMDWQIVKVIEIKK